MENKTTFLFFITITFNNLLIRYCDCPDVESDRYTTGRGVTW